MPSSINTNTASTSHSADPSQTGQDNHHPNFFGRHIKYIQIGGSVALAAAAIYMAISKSNKNMVGAIATAVGSVSLASTYNTFLQEKTSSDAKIKKLTEQNQSLNNTILQEKTSSEAKIKELTELNQSLNNDVRSIPPDYQLLRTEFTATDEAIAALQLKFVDLSASSGKNYNGFASHLAAKESEKAALQTQNNDLQNQIEKLHLENEELRTQLEEAQILLMNKDSDPSEINAEIAKLSDALEAQNRANIAEKTALQSQNNDLSTQLEQLHSENEELRSQLTETQNSISIKDSQFKKLHNEFELYKFISNMKSAPASLMGTPIASRSQSKVSSSVNSPDDKQIDLLIKDIDFPNSPMGVGQLDFAPALSATPAQSTASQIDTNNGAF